MLKTTLIIISLTWAATAPAWQNHIFNSQPRMLQAGVPIINVGAQAAKIRLLRAQAELARTRAALIHTRRQSSPYSNDCESGHWISDKTSDGSILVLEDGSKWEVDLTDRTDSSLWQTTDDIILCSNYMINTSDSPPEKIQVSQIMD